MMQVREVDIHGAQWSWSSSDATMGQEIIDSSAGVGGHSSRNVFLNRCCKLMTRGMVRLFGGTSSFPCEVTYQQREGFSPFNLGVPHLV